MRVGGQDWEHLWLVEPTTYSVVYVQQAQPPRHVKQGASPSPCAPFQLCRCSVWVSGSGLYKCTWDKPAASQLLYGILTNLPGTLDIAAEGSTPTPPAKSKCTRRISPGNMARLAPARVLVLLVVLG